MVLDPLLRGDVVVVVFADDFDDDGNRLSVCAVCHSDTFSIHYNHHNYTTTEAPKQKKDNQKHCVVCFETRFIKRFFTLFYRY